MDKIFGLRLLYQPLRLAGNGLTADGAEVSKTYDGLPIDLFDGPSIPLRGWMMLDASGGDI